ncbi:hypothetical protein PHYBOEH_000824 [Phytophthora boehmeriae]|uniref:Uncharacterized protein n=1 Tax=Phytophthora boehmeriae TaxID=109152 RepID=A0A8T1WYP6_9STRA|nr:hypothetical protein PHYBOEH_000824 [Phytophthora boehmeriae]
MTAWSDVWRSAQLRLQLRDECLFQGETVGVDVCADVPPSVGSTGKYEGQQRVDTLLQRWKAHCEGAQAQIQIVDESSPDPHASSSRSTSTTLFRQETQFSVVSVDREDGNPASVVRLRAHFDLKVRREFWDRKVLLVVNITPRRSVDEGMQSDMKTASGERERSLLMDEWTSELLSLTREEAQPTLTMTRRVERHVTVTKPLRLDVETKDLEKRRVGILARVTNTHPTLSLSVRDLHLHLNQSLRGTEAGSFRVVSGDKVPFPVVLLPQERYNFLYMLEPEEVVASQESSEDQVPTSAVQRKAKKDSSNEAQNSGVNDYFRSQRYTQRLDHCHRALRLQDGAGIRGVRGLSPVGADTTRHECQKKFAHRISSFGQKYGGPVSAGG